MKFPLYNEPIPLFAWIGHQNFGDELSPYLIERITGAKPHLKHESYNNKLVAIGSLINPGTLSSKSYFWGTGILHERILDNFPKKFKLFPLNRAYSYTRLKMHYTYNQPFYALRGPLTASLLEEKGFNVANTRVFSDPAILLPYVYNNRIDQHYSLGVLCHHSQPTEALQKLIEDRYSQKVKFIPILRSGDNQLEQCIDEICSCERIASTSLHGLILAQAYGCASIYLQDMINVLEDNSVFKFHDYFLGTKQEPQDPVQFTDYAELIPKLLKMSFPDPPKFRQLCQNLLDVFPKPNYLKIKSLPY